MSAGSIKADEWRLLIMAYIPLALISLWSSARDPAITKPFQSTMELVSAVYLSCAQTTSVDHAKAYQNSIASYVGKLKECFPHFDLRPNHHASIHIYDYLMLFGPVRSWWTFPFERLIGFLQRLPSNHKTGVLHVIVFFFWLHIAEFLFLGELKNTMLQSYLKGAKLRSWLSHPDCPTVIRECKVLLDQAYRFMDGNLNISHDGLVMTTESMKVTKVPSDLEVILKRQTAVLCAHVKDKTGVVYSRASIHIGNSLILFYPWGIRSLKPVPGSIKYIYEEEDSYVFAVQRQLPLSEAKSDPFTAYPHFPDQQYSAALQGTLECVRFSWVCGHYARWAISDDWVVVLNLFRVSWFPSVHSSFHSFIWRYH